LKNSENDKNPLRIVLYIFLLLATHYVYAFTKTIFSDGLHEIISNKMHLVIAFFLIVTFLIAYHKKSVLAWWIALLFCPIVLSIHAILYDPPTNTPLSYWKTLILLLSGWLVFICPYLADKYKPYKSFIGNYFGGQEQFTQPELKKSTNDNNPLETLLFACLGVAVFSVYMFINRMLDKSQGGLMSSLIDFIISMLFIMTFLLAYHRRWILAWWIALLFLPITACVSAILYGPLPNWKTLLLFMVGWLILICPYLATRYKLYSNFVAKHINKNV
jgi:hypothetical protein